MRDGKTPLSLAVAASGGGGVGTDMGEGAEREGDRWTANNACCTEKGGGERTLSPSLCVFGGSGKGGRRGEKGTQSHQKKKRRRGKVAGFGEQLERKKGGTSGGHGRRRR